MRRYSKYNEYPFLILKPKNLKLNLFFLKAHLVRPPFSSLMKKTCARFFGALIDMMTSNHRTQERLISIIWPRLFPKPHWYIPIHQPTLSFLMVIRPYCAHVYPSIYVSSIPISPRSDQTQPPLGHPSLIFIRGF